MCKTILIKNSLLIILICSFATLFAQEKVAMKEIYIDNHLAYKIINDELFSGQAQRVRKNEHLVYEEYYEKGVPIKSILYYNRTEPPKPARMIEFYEGSFNKKKETNYGLDKSLYTEFKYYDRNGKKTLIEQYNNNKLTYRCEYLNNKKHGKEFGYGDDGNKVICEYRNGKKISLE